MAEKLSTFLDEFIEKKDKYDDFSGGKSYTVKELREHYKSKRLGKSANILEKDNIPKDVLDKLKREGLKIFNGILSKLDMGYKLMEEV